MIEIDLSPGDKNKDLAVIAGINLSLINIKLLLPFIALVYLIEPSIEFFFEEDIAAVKASILDTRKKTRDKTAELRKYDEIKDQVKKLNAQQKNLKAKIEIVKEIVDKRQNPYAILKYIADNTPGDVWINSLNLQNKRLVMVGYSKSWKSIGKFMENLKDSIFFSGDVLYKKSEKLREEAAKRQVETFEITTNIVSFK